MMTWRTLVTQLALFADVPVVHTVLRPARRYGLPPVDRVLLDLAPYLPADAEPRHHAESVEIPLVRGHALERFLRRLGFRRRARPFDYVRPKRSELRQVVIDLPKTERWFWRLDTSRGRR